MCRGLFFSQSYTMEPFGHCSFWATFVSGARPTPDFWSETPKKRHLKVLFSLITEFSFLLQMLPFHVNIAVYLVLWTVMSFCWLWDKSCMALFEWFSRVGVVSVSWHVIRILATLILVCLSFSKYLLLKSRYFVKVPVPFLLIMEFPVARGKTLQRRAKHTLEISSENTNPKNPSFYFLNMRSGQGEIGSCIPQQAWRNGSRYIPLSWGWCH